MSHIRKYIAFDVGIF